MRKLLPISLVAVCMILQIVFSFSLFAQAAPEKYEGVMLQAFYWGSYAKDSKWTTLASSAPEVAKTFDVVWLPPSNKSSGGMGYIPIYYFNHNSDFGSQEQLKSLISDYHANGVKVVADIVINHRGNLSTWTDFPQERYNGVTHTWGPEVICSGDEVRNQAGQAKPTGAADTGINYEAARDIDHTSSKVQGTINAYLDFMKSDLGFDGWRFDYAKGFSPSYFGQYCKSANKDFAFGEYFDGNYDLVTGWIDGTKVDGQIRTGALDFPLKFALNKACNNGQWNELVWKRGGTLDQPAGLIHMEGFTRFAYTFVENHDTEVARGPSDGGQNALTKNILAANAFIICSPGIPVVFYRHWLSYKTQISEMIAARKHVGAHSQSMVEVLQSSTQLYAAKLTGKTGSLIVKVGPGSYNAPSDYTLKTFGENYAIWTKGGQAPIEKLSLSVTPASGFYQGGTDVTFTASGGTAPYKIYYTTDGSTPTVSSTQVASGASIHVSEACTIKAFAADATNQATSITSREYITQTTNITVRLKDPGWASVNFYAWTDETADLLGKWPGKAITKDAEGWYSYTFDNAVSVSLVFSSGTGTPQTTDVNNIMQSSCYQIGADKEGTKFVPSLATCPGSAVDQIESLSTTLYPNPVQDILHISSAEPIRSLRILTLSGAVIMVDSSVLSTTTAINVGSLSQGVYLLSTTNKEGICHYRKFIKL